MNQAPHTLEGWYTLHDFRSLDWSRWKQADADTRRLAVAELTALVQSWEETAAKRLGSFGLYSIAGHKADLLFLHMRPTLEELIQVKTDFQKTRFAEFVATPYSYVSVVELGGYLAKEGVDPDTDPHLQSRLKPAMPEASHVCFYPMNKRRLGNDNWYMLPPEERREMLKNHGSIGRAYADRVKQIITGSVGLDDWEWGVTLFANDPLHFKKLVYEMRFDEGSARFGEFGPFYVGHRLTEQQFARMVAI